MLSADIGVYGKCQDFPDFSIPRRRPLENSTSLDLIHPEDGAPNGTSSAGFAVSSQAVIVDLPDSLEAPPK